MIRASLGWLGRTVTAVDPVKPRVASQFADVNVDVAKFAPIRPDTDKSTHSLAAFLRIAKALGPRNHSALSSHLGYCTL